MTATVLLLAALLAPGEAPAGAPAADKARAKPASVTVTRPAPEPAVGAEAREAARRCEEDEDRDAALAACREALRLGLREPRRAAVRQLLEQRLAADSRFDELVEAYREDTEHAPQDAFAWRRLGTALLHFKEDAAGALRALEEARRLRPEDAETLLSLGVCLNALGDYVAAVAAFEEALRLEPAALDLRPAGRAALEASRRGERWP